MNSIGTVAIGASLLFSAHTYAQLDLDWGRSASGPADEQGRAAAVDQSGNTLHTGAFAAVIDLLPGQVGGELTGLGSSAFIGQYDPSGNLTFSMALSSTIGISTNAIQFRPGGGFVVAGIFLGTVGFDPNDPNDVTDATGLGDAFIASYDQFGNLSWVKTIGSSQGVQATDLAVNSNGWVYWCGFFEGTVTVVEGGTTYSLVSNGDTDAVVGCLAPDGATLWLKSFGGPSVDRATALSIGDGTVGVCGDFGGTVDLDPGAGQDPHMSFGGMDMFMLLFDHWGSSFGGRTFGGTGEDHAADIAFDAMFAWYLAGSFEGVLQNGMDGSAMALSTGDKDGFLICTGNAGYIYWTKQFGGTGPDAVLSVMANDFDRLNICGQFTDADLTEGIQLANAGGTDVFLAVLDANGSVAAAYAIGSAAFELVHSVAANASGSVVITGAFNSAIDVDLGTGDETLTSTTDLDVFTVKYSNTQVSVPAVFSPAKEFLIGNPSSSGHFDLLTERPISSAMAFDDQGRSWALPHTRGIGRCTFHVSTLAPGGYLGKFYGTGGDVTVHRFVVIR